MTIVAGTLGSCPEKIDHHKDGGMEMHGSPEEPIQIEESRKELGVRWEYQHIDRTLMLPKRCVQSLIMKDGKSLDRIVVRDAAFRHHVFYFDVTGALAAGTRQFADVIENLKKNRDKLSPEAREMLAEIERDEKRLGRAQG
jgi:hypothetical protein